MCGIVFIHRFDNQNPKKSVAKRYRQQQHRGKEGFGFLAINHDLTLNTWTRSTEDISLLKEMNELPNSVCQILFHHRMPTSTPNFIEATHPIAVENATLDHVYFVVHNGVISNATILRDKHIAQGFVYTTEFKHVYKHVKNEYPIPDKVTFNDTEALAVELALVLDGKKEKIDTWGSVAFIAYQMTVVGDNKLKLKNVFYGRNFGSPIKVQRNNQYLSLCSEGAGDLIESNMIYCFDPVTGAISKEAKDVGNSIHTVDYTSTYGKNIKNNWNAHGNRAEDDDDDVQYGFKSHKHSMVDTAMASKTQLSLLPSETSIATSDGLNEALFTYKPEDVYYELIEQEARLVDDLEIANEYKLEEEAKEYRSALFGIRAAIRRIEFKLNTESKSLDKAVNEVLGEDIKDEDSVFEATINRIETHRKKAAEAAQNF